MMDKEIDVEMKQAWAVLWLLWCKQRSIDITGLDAVVKS